MLLVTSDQESAILPADLDLPNRRRLQERGVTFTHAFCNTPQCSPARAAILTGRTPLHAGVVTNVDPGSLGVAPSPALPTLASTFRSAGYATGFFGKWHLGNKGPEQFGFTSSDISSSQTLGSKADEPATRVATNWIGQQRGPWMAWVSLLDPHDIYFPPYCLANVEPRSGVRPPFSGSENLEGKPHEQRDFLTRASRTAVPTDWIRYRSYYCDLLERVDNKLGMLLDACRDLDSMVIAYTSGHGDGLGEHGLPFKGPFMYDELVRIPLVISAPKSLGMRGKRDSFATQADLMPTLASLAGVRIPAGLDSINLAAKGAERDAVFLEYGGQQHSIYPIRTIHTGTWKLNWYDSGGKELYDLKRDPPS
ncbi:MAG: sulfatase-like hydrolase/transferase [Acidobacteriota bacterium]|nr:sulfatase-like hydrolase/transferase [Acidobacteriota bacterium]